MSKRQLFAGLLFGMLLISCGLNNTMFNARKYFKAAQARPLNSNGKPTPQAVDEYTKTIQKCGVILTEQKGSKIVDDALFLLARALYYKGNSAFQAKDQFEALIKGFPDSPFVPEAHIYLARVLRQINRPQESENLLESFVRDNRHLKYHPRALMVLAEFEIGDKDYLRAQYWLQRIINEYPHTPEFKEAFFLFGKNYYEQRDYAASLREFDKFVETRGINKELKLEGRYYMALNLFEMGEIERSTRIVSSLINDESRPEKLSLVRVLNARLLLAGKDPQKGITEVDDISKAYPRSTSSAAAYYYLGEHYFYRVKNIDQATTAYNKVRTEFPASELVSPAQQKTTAITQLKQSQNLSVTGNLQQFVDYHMLAAENYLTAFALPDSALLMYDRILAAPAPLRAKLDSLDLEITNIGTRSDSLDTRIIELEELMAADLASSDSLGHQIDAVETPTDTLKTTVTLDDELIESPDSLQFKPLIPGIIETAEPDSLTIPAILSEDIASPEPDSLQTQISVAEETAIPAAESPDSLSVSIVTTEPPEESTDATEPELQTTPASDEEVKAPAAINPRTTELSELKTLSTSLKTQLASLDTQTKELTGILTRFDTDILPLVYFAKASLLSKQNATADSLRDIFELMQASFPTDKYTNALRMLKAGEPVRLIDPEEDRQNAVLDEALGLYIDQPDSMRVLLEELSQSQYSNIRLRANFRVAWMHSFELADTLSAKPYLDEVLKHPQGAEYADLARKFYDGKNFMFPKPAPDTLSAPDSLSTGQDGEAEKDETDIIDAVDPLNPDTEAETDSLDSLPKLIQTEFPDQPDSLDLPDPIETEVVPAEADSLPTPLILPVEPDSLNIAPGLEPLGNPVLPDSLAAPINSPVEQDSLAAPADPLQPGTDGVVPQKDTEAIDPVSPLETSPVLTPLPDQLSEPQESAHGIGSDAPVETPEAPSPPVLPPSGDPELE